ncbi:MAG TPA: HAMP domain-containing sensor histidine kinase [Candidatus Binatus sp.]|nr:HAMP domain-containing sensor histidine kinase [Candidatus Binatus sp.]
MPAPTAVPDAYRLESRRLRRQAASTACLLAIPLVPCFAVLDWVVFPGHFAIFLGMRLACVATLALIWWVLQRSFGERYSLALGMLVTIDVGLMIDVMTMMTGGHASPYYAGVNLVILAVALLMPWHPAWSAVTCAILIGGYVVCSLLAGPIADSRIFVNNLFFLGTTGVIAVVGTAVRDGLRRREFANRHALTEALHHRDVFMAKMSHELRTPIHVMIGYADMLLDEVLAAGEQEARPLVESVRREGVLLHSLISDLLDYAKVEAGKMEVRAEPVPVRQVVEQVADAFRPLSERKGVRLDTVYRGGFPTVTSDGQKIKQILNNLVGNALKFTEHGAITIEVCSGSDATDPVLGELTFLAEPPDDRGRREGVVLLVRDTGIGIRDEDVRTLATDFQQVDAQAAARYGGTGLGLSISKKLAQLLGGWIAVRTRYREGSTFVVFLPSLTAA